MAFHLAGEHPVEVLGPIVKKAGGGMDRSSGRDGGSRLLPITGVHRQCFNLHVVPEGKADRPTSTRILRRML
jgi:hypothetical protein